MRNILIIGATSAVAKETARIFAHKGDKLYLLARNHDRLVSLAKDLEIRGASIIMHDQFNASDFESHKQCINNAFTRSGHIDIILIAHGSLPKQKSCEEDFSTALDEINTNALSTISLLTYIANNLELQKHGTVAVITSVAGDRGRQSNYIYGSAKAMISVFLQGLGNRLEKSGVNVVNIKPGFIDTPMTAGFKKNLLWSKPDKIAAAIIKAIESKKTVAYTPWYWRYIMLIIKLIPTSVFNKLKL